jgi:hypothetical protein
MFSLRGHHEERAKLTPSSTELRKMKDRALAAADRERFREAAVLYAQIARHEPDGDWLQRAGDAARRGGLADQAVEYLATACRSYATRGFEQKALALAKVVLQLEPSHAGTLSLVRELAARRAADESTTPPIIASGHTDPTR